MKTPFLSRACLPAYVAALGLTGVMMAWGPGYAPAMVQHAHAAGIPASVPADLERDFWRCDYAATTGSVGADTAMACIAITDELKMTKFKGDFMALLAWWREHKPAQHRALRAASGVRGSAASFEGR